MFKGDKFRQAAQRHARFYLDQLREVNTLYQGGGAETQRAIAGFGEHWSQIKQGQAWAAKHMPELCRDYCAAGEHIFIALRPVTEHVAWLQAGIEAACQLNDHASEAQFLNFLGQACMVVKNIEQSQRHYVAALQIARQYSLQCEEGYALIGLGRLCHLSSATREEARQHLETAVTIFREIEDGRGCGWSLHNLGTVNEYLGNLAVAQAQVEEAYQLFSQIGDQRLIANALNRLAAIYERQQAYEAAIEKLQAALVIAEALTDAQTATNTLNTLGLVYSLMGDNVASRKYYEKSLTLTQQSGNKHQMAVTLLNLGYVAEVEEDYPTAQRYYADALAACQAIGMEYRLLITWQHLCFVRLLQGDTAGLADELKEILTRILEADARDLIQAVLTSFAWLYLLDGEPLRSAELLGIIQAHPEWEDEENAPRLERVHQMLDVHLSFEEREAGFEQGKRAALAAIYQRLLAN